jgi:hypothetical protein
VANLPQKPSQTKRIDPETRPVTAVSVTQTVIRNRDPKRHYVLVYKADHDLGIPHYQALGYEMERVREGGVSLPMMSTTDGDVIEQRGHVLMSCPIEVLQARFKQEQASFDAIERRIVRNTSGVDGLRGISKQVLAEGSLRFENETKEARPEPALGG